jgi:short-subunit dehydrogenase
MAVKLKKIEDQTMVVTGASSGIGRATAKAAAAKGARVVLAARDEPSLREAVEEIEAAGGEALSMVADVTDRKAVLRVAETAERELGGFDTWVNNAGTSIYGPIRAVPEEDARRLFDTNYWGVVHGSLVAAEHLRDRGGAIINIGSVLSDRAIPLQGHYSATKHAVKAFTEAFRMELEKEDAPISVTLVKPAAIATQYAEHSTNHLDDGEPALPPPLYAPEVVARAILECAQHPVRDVSVGAGGRVLGIAGQLLPRTMDRYMEASMFERQKRDGDGRLHRSNLYDAVPGSGRTRGDHDGHVMESSLYTSASLHPWRTLLGLGMLAGLGAAVTSRMRN